MNVDMGKQWFDGKEKYFIWKYNYCYENSLDTLGKSYTRVIWALEKIACRWDSIMRHSSRIHLSNFIEIRWTVVTPSKPHSKWIYT